ncbi:MAG: glycogen/starch/alpha-glucan phosphorylase [Salinarimonas sp.]|nr:glycogen/starch/alpha-glucan phosphorylase [Salinarimonas sp.]
MTDKLVYAVGKDTAHASLHDWYVAAALAVRDRIVDRWMESTRETYRQNGKRVYYLSLEFLIGRNLRDAVSNLGLMQPLADALSDLGVDPEVLREQEADAALGNGGLGRLAACFMESLASLSLPAIGYGIRYDYGLFRQVIRDGAQHEVPEDWLDVGNPWEFKRPEATYRIGFGGGTRDEARSDGAIRRVWEPAESVLAVAYDTPVVGWRGAHVNTLRLWAARASEPLMLEAFNHGDYVGAMAHRARAEAISRVLYPSDATPAGYELRLRQEYFFTAASLQDLVRRHLSSHPGLDNLADHAAIQLNDTHPAIAVAELMRILVDDHAMAWERAWAVTRETLSYTNHTLLPEALETWSVPLMERLLPRHMEIIYRINWLHLEAVSTLPDADGTLSRALSIIDEENGKRVRMGHLAFIGAHKINGVSALHTDLMRETVFADLHRMFPERITNKTNGVTFRRWLQQINPRLTSLLVETIGPRVLDHPQALRELERHADDPTFRRAFAEQRLAAKRDLARLIGERTGIVVDPMAMFDVQIKRIHEYKRQLLNLLETVALYNAIKADPDAGWVPRVKIFAGKAAASYVQAKQIIRLAHDLGAVINNDPDIGGKLKLVFLPNYNVSLAEVIIPAADLSEQISTAGMEASGTGNMKLALNGALTIGTLDGANVEMRDHVGAENIIIFGHDAQEVAALRAAGYCETSTLDRSTRLARALFEIETGLVSPDEPRRYAALTEAVAWRDRYMIAADFDAYWQSQRDLDALWLRPDEWWRTAILNTAGMGWFSSDRTIGEYAQDIWRVQPLPHSA